MRMPSHFLLTRNKNGPVMPVLLLLPHQSPQCINLALYVRRQHSSEPQHKEEQHKDYKLYSAAVCNLFPDYHPATLLLSLATEEAWLGMLAILPIVNWTFRI